jgi:hypothetical protein
VLTNFAEYEFDSEAGVPVRVQVLTPRTARNWSSPLIWVTRAVEQVDIPAIDPLLPLVDQCPIAILTPRLGDNVLSTRELARLQRTAALTGRTIAALQVWDVIRTVHWLRKELALDTQRVTLYGRRDAAVVALYAAVLSDNVSHTVLEDPPGGQRQTAAAILTVLRHGDLPQVAALLAPRTLSVVGHRYRAFEFTRGAFRRRQAASSFGIFASVAEAVFAARERARDAERARSTQ